MIHRGLLWASLLLAASTPVLADQNGGAPSVCAASTQRETQSIGTRLFTLLVKGDGSANVAVSPASLREVLEVLQLGASGHTRQLLLSTLAAEDGCRSDLTRDPKSGPGKVVFESATSVWVRNDLSLLPAFVESAKRCCAAHADLLPQIAPELAVNRWVSENTHGRIKEIVSSLGPQVLLTIVNAAYFGGSWTMPFDSKLTKHGAFVLTDGKRKVIPFMTQSGYFPLHRDIQFDWIRLPYGNGQFAMDLLLPQPSKDPADLIATLLSLGRPGSTGSTPPSEVRIELPRFGLDSASQLATPMATLGLGEVFDLTKAGFRNMVANQGQLAVSDIQHKIHLTVHEAGTEAAAATAVMMVGALPGSSGPPVLRFDRPFLLAIRDTRSGQVLFLAAVRNPE